MSQQTTSAPDTQTAPVAIPRRVVIWKTGEDGAKLSTFLLHGDVICFLPTAEEVRTSTAVELFEDAGDILALANGRKVSVSMDVARQIGPEWTFVEA